MSGFLKSLVILGVLAFLPAGIWPVQGQPVDDPTAPALQQMARAFVQKAAEHPAFSMEVAVEGEGTWHVRFDGNGGAAVGSGPATSPVFRFATDLGTFRRIAEGDLTGMTAMGQARPSDPTPLDMDPGPGADDVEDVRALFFQVAMHFFNPTVPGHVELGEEHARVIHGAPGVALFYHEGFRSGWFHVGPGQQLNEPGDTNPFPQTFVIIGGAGTATIGGDTISVQSGRAYFVPPNSDHVLWPEEGGHVELIWIAWGEGA